MSDLTEIDLAHAAMEAAPEDDAARLRLYERLSDSELFLLLNEEAEGDQISPATFEVEDQVFVLVFDRIERLTQFAGEVVPYAGLSGRNLATMLGEQDIGWAFNPEVAPSTMLLGADTVRWLAQTLRDGPAEIESRIEMLSAPTGVPETLLGALDRKLATSTGLADLAYLVNATHESGAKSHMLIFVDTLPEAREVLAGAVNEALTFSGIEAGLLDVVHIKGSDGLAAQAARVGLRFDLPKPAAPSVPGANPGMDPDRPPKLR